MQGEETAGSTECSLFSGYLSFSCRKAVVFTQHFILFLRFLAAQAFGSPTISASPQSHVCLLPPAGPQVPLDRREHDQESCSCRPHINPERLPLQPSASVRPQKCSKAQSRRAVSRLSLLANQISITETTCSPWLGSA